VTVNFGLNGRRALVSGAAGGLGAAIADGLAELGAQVIATSRNGSTAHRLGARYGTKPCTLDVRDTGSIHKVVDQVWADGALDILVNNAGVNRPAAMLDVTEADWDTVVDTNLKGVFFLTQVIVGRMMAENKPGSVVNIGSQAGMVGIEHRAAYCASKGGLVQLTRTMALELAEHGIRVNSVAPTFALTELTRTTLEQPDLRQRFLGRIPMGRFARPEDVVGAVAYLSGDMAAMVTGHTLLVDGGWTAR
jgi:NAD(P)-dependent dehydrogenase (short-subunit alcohol dehydrogenase family)